MALPINIDRIDVTIASGQSLSARVDLGAKVLVGIAMPTDWDAAALTFQVSQDGSETWLEHTTSAGNAVSFTVDAGQYIAVDPVLWRGVNAVRLRSGTAVTPVNQSANRTLTLITRTVA
jgi:hypothetical protein